MKQPDTVGVKISLLNERMAIQITYPTITFQIYTVVCMLDMEIIYISTN